MARLYTNENFPRQVAVALRALGHDVLTVADMPGQAQRIHEAILAAGPLAGQLLRVNRPPR